MLPPRILEKLLATLPKSVTMGNGNVLPVWVESAPSVTTGVEEDDRRSDDKYPAIIVQFVGSRKSPSSPLGGFFNEHPNESTQASEETTLVLDEFAYAGDGADMGPATGPDVGDESQGYTNTGSTDMGTQNGPGGSWGDATQEDYRVSEPDIVPGSTVVTGTRLGVPNYVFVRGVDYVEADTDADGALDSIQWTSTGASPDNETSFKVAYRHYTPATEKGEQTIATVQIHALARTMQIGGAATAEHVAEDIMGTLLRDLTHWAVDTAKDGLVGLAVVGERGAVGDFSYLEGRGVIRQGFDLPLEYRVSSKTTAKSLHSVEATITTTVDPSLTSAAPAKFSV